MSFLAVFGRPASASPWDSEEAIRAELFSAERLDEHAKSLAAAQIVTTKPVSRQPLASRLKDNESVLLAAYQTLGGAARQGQAMTPAAEWLLDNFHLVEESIREARDDLPPGYYKQLPKLAEGPCAGYPRVFGIAWAFVAHTDSRFDPGMLCRFVRAYQTVQPLTIGELWAVAITLKIVLVENLRRAAKRLMLSREAREEANNLADRLLGIDGRVVESTAATLSHYEQEALPTTFAVQLVQRLRDQDPKVTPALRWLEEQLTAHGATGDELVQSEHLRQGAASATVRNIITSMRLISSVDWAELFEATSLVDGALQLGDNFVEMDFPTRNLYRNAIEVLARGSDLSELEIAQQAVAMARVEQVNDVDIVVARRRHDPGHYLIGGGRSAFEKTIGYRAPVRCWLSRFNARAGIGFYIASVLVVAALALLATLYVVDHVGLRTLLLLAVVGLVPAVDMAVALVNRLVAALFGAAILPGLALRNGIPAELRTIVVVPSLLTSKAALEEQIERLEVHYLASPEGEVFFALLSDWSDAPTEHTADDQWLLDTAVDAIAKLNAQYGAGMARFFLLHRRRVWNAAQGVWMGWERKRGKLHELNRLLRGASDTSFLPLAGLTMPADVRFVITLDADTRLPRETVRKLIGKMAHPLNRPRFDPTAGRVTEGYAILQPRVTPSLPVGREGSLFQRVFSSMSGVDPYASAVSDVYQDLFGEGSFTGKGIYDVDAFETAMQDRVPENTLLSHDLFEGSFARAGLASDVEVVEEFPARSDVAAARQHRWARGDWQLLPWILGYGQATRRAGALPAVGRWKMLDNLRRSLSAPVGILALLVGWMLSPRDALIWSGFVVSTIAVPALLPALAAIVPGRVRVTLGSHLRALAADLWLALSQTGFVLAFQAFQAWSMVDAITRTLFRLFVSRRNLLEWVTAAHANLSPRLQMNGFIKHMAGAAVVAAVATAAIWLRGGDTLPIAAPFIAAWLASPVLAFWASRVPAVAGRIPMSSTDATALRLIARRTWRFFETFVTAADNFLPPDNFQEDPKPVVAHRTSPTNMGLYLLSVVSARDFGWIGTDDALQRVETTLAAMKKLERFRGHFYNWYDTSDLRPLDPRYVSSVDSGNLAGHLIALSGACREWMSLGVPRENLFAGIADALLLAREARAALAGNQSSHAVAYCELDAAFDMLEGALGPNDVVLSPEHLAALAGWAATIADMARALAISDEAGGELCFWAEAIQHSIASHHRDVNADRQSLLAQLQRISDMALDMAEAMEFGFLVDKQRKLLAIGYLATDGRLDESSYDLLASEARLGSFVAIAKGDIPTRHWFRLGRAVTPMGRGAALISWSGSMFEYLMPSLVLRAPAGSLLAETNRLIVQRQIAYGQERGTPWGVSEAAFNARDLELTYQYSNFGVPGLGLKRGLGENIVVAPYATALAAMVDPRAAVRNFARLAVEGARGRYGFYEAVDYTKTRLPEGQSRAVIQAFMAHHQGMTVVAIANALFDGRMRSRFHAAPSVQATELLLQERTPRDVAADRPWADELRASTTSIVVNGPSVRRIQSAHSATPATHLLSNGRYAVMLTAAGSGYSRWRGLAVTRWREDITRDDWGAYIFLRDLRNGAVWSAGLQPSGAEPDSYEARFSEDRAEFSRRDGAISTQLDVVLSPEADAEVRRVSVTNHGLKSREIELTSYAELVLAPAAADNAHPAFSKLFVQTEYDAKTGVLLATRRRRSPEEPEIWAAHLAVVEGRTIGQGEFETDRSRFIGRCRELRSSAAMMDEAPLSGATGTVLDAIFSLRRKLRVAPGETARIAFWTIVAPSRAELLDLVDKHQDVHAFERVVTLAWTQAQVQLRHLDIGAEEAQLFQRLAGRILYAGPSMRPPSEVIRKGSGGPDALWSQRISGDLPIVLVRIDDIADISVVAALLRAHEYWRMKHLAVDLVILNERSSSYVQDLHNAIETMVRMSQSRPQAGEVESRGGVFVLRSDLISQETRQRLPAVARVVLAARQGSLSDQLDRRHEPSRPAPPLLQSTASTAADGAPLETPNLEFFNGLGGFAADGREYITVLTPGRATPAPWLNVIANPHFGFQVTAEGGGYTWSGNSRENQLTPWCNDPVSDRPGEVLYIRDEDTGEIWAPTALPVRQGAGRYLVRHGQGYSRFEHDAHNIRLDLTQFVPRHDPLKISRLKIRNMSGRTRRLSVTAYVDWVLGPSRAASAPFVTTEIDTPTGALFARNPWNTTFGAHVAFLDMAGRQTSWTGDRREFLGRNGSLDNPAALAGLASLSNRTGAGLDPCGALQTLVTLGPGESTEVIVFLGQAESAADAQFLLAHYRERDVEAVFREVLQHWEDLLGAVQVKSPDRSMDIMLNRWLLYQTTACRLWARSAYYQASGAYGFRDQLQDAMALALVRPEMTREHLLRAAARQFVEGDVQHWWLPPYGQGVRTRISDDRIWLAHAAAHYVHATGDHAVLDEMVPFVEGPTLASGEHDAYFQPGISERSASLFEHCARGLDLSLQTGAHGLPLIGAGDWNDGMNRVGAQGQGESVWLGWFLYKTLRAFIPIAKDRGEEDRVASWLSQVDALKAALERGGWDGLWYRRGYFDDATPLGSAANDECRIDSIAQSWSVLSGAGDPARAALAMKAVDAQLIRRDAGLALLFTPPFDHTPLDPGYIKGYPPGIRENGGQYTHAAVWSVIAFAELGDGDKATALFDMLNPIQHADTRAGIQRYKVEPYVVAADVYSEPPHVGRGGWTWYTGAAGWLYRAGIESILGVRRQGGFLLVDPCVPQSWPEFALTYRYGTTRYDITVENNGAGRGVIAAELDGRSLVERPLRVPLCDDGSAHQLHVVLSGK